MDPQAASGRQNQLVAAASMVARHAEYAVRVVLPHSCPLIEAEHAAEQAGVDVVVARTEVQATVHFIARHQDRRVAREQVRATVPFVQGRHAQAARKAAAPRAVDVRAFRRASEELGLDPARQPDPDVEVIWGYLLRASATAHVCGGITTLVVNDVGGLVGILRRRARTLGVTMRINPDVCACS